VEEEKSNIRIFPLVSLDTKSPLAPHCWSTHTKVLLSSHKVHPKATLAWLGTKTHGKPLGHIKVVSTRKLLHIERGLHIPSHRRRCHLTPSRTIETFARATKTLGTGTPCTIMVHFRTWSQGRHILHSHQRQSHQSGKPWWPPDLVSSNSSSPSVVSCYFFELNGWRRRLWTGFCPLRPLPFYLAVASWWLVHQSTSAQ
jgi:hypothetical protein